MSHKIWLLPVVIVIVTLLSMIAILFAGPLNAGSVVTWCQNEIGDDAFIGFYTTTNDPWKYQDVKGVGSVTMPAFRDPDGYDNKSVRWAVGPNWSCPTNDRVLSGYLRINTYITRALINVAVTCDKKGCIVEIY